MITTEDIKAFAEKAIKPAKKVELGSDEALLINSNVFHARLRGVPKKNGLTRLHNEITVAEVRDILAEEGGVGRDC